MLILEDIRRYLHELTFYLHRIMQRIPQKVRYAYISVVFITTLCLLIDNTTSFRPVPLNESVRSTASALVRVHLLILMFYGFCRYYVWARSRLVSDEARVNTMRKDTMNAIAHEVRTPLAAILGYAENLRLGIAEDKKDYYLEQIEVKGNEISRMIDEILSLAKLEDSDCSLAPEALSMNNLIFEITSQMDAVFNIEEKDEWFIDADREYIIRMLKCLLDNAVRYRTPDTPVMITIGRYSLKIHNQCEPLSEETLNHIFEFSSKADGRYSFGLFFCRKAAEANGLKLRVYNEIDGVTVSLY